MSPVSSSPPLPGDPHLSEVTRRRFLTWSGVAGGTALAAGATAIALPRLLAAGGALAEDAPVLVLVTLYGGNDGLNTVVPYADPAYRKARPDLAFAEDEVLALEDGFGLNPSLRGFKGLWDEGRLAIVQGVSYPKPDRSHFASMDIWQTASPTSPSKTGWIGRWLDATGRDPLRAVSLDATLPPMMAGENCTGAALRLGRAGFPDRLRPGFSALARASDGEPPAQALVARSLADLLRTDETFGKLKDDPEPADDEAAENDANDEAVAEGSVAGGQGRLARQLNVVSRCIKARVPTRVYSVSLGGFDTHAAEKVIQPRLLAQLDKAVSGFLRTAGDGVVVMVYSEFGRRVAVNGNQGTDHGTSGPVLIAGTSVRGGFYGEQPSLTDLAGDDLKVSIDFRDVYATLLTDVLDADPERVLGDTRSPVPFL